MGNTILILRGTGRGSFFIDVQKNLISIIEPLCNLRQIHTLHNASPLRRRGPGSGPAALFPIHPPVTAAPGTCLPSCQRHGCLGWSSRDGGGGWMIFLAANQKHGSAWTPNQSARRGREYVIMGSCGGRTPTEEGTTSTKAVLSHPCLRVVTVFDDGPRLVVLPMELPKEPSSTSSTPLSSPAVPELSDTQINRLAHTGILSPSPRTGKFCHYQKKSSPCAWEGGECRCHA